MDSDGDQDLVVVSFDGTVRWFRSDGSGGIVGVEPIADGLNDPRACGLGDLDGDGDLDAVISDTVDRSVTWRRNMGGGRFGEAQTIVEDTVVRDYATPHDVDGDGDLDVMYARQWQGGDQLAWRSNDGVGGFGPELLLGSGFYLQPVPYDVDGDGDLDLVARDGNYHIGWWENVSPGAYVQRPIITEGCYTFGMADLDGDGDLDLHVARGLVIADVQVLPNDGQGNFGPPITIFTSDRRPLDMVLMDVDGDGADDLLVSVVFDREVVWCRGLGGLNFDSPALLHGIEFPPRLATFDADLDGDRDLVIGSSSDFGFSRIRVGQNTGSAPYLQLEDVMELTAGVQAAHLVDLDRDGDDDVVWSRANDRIIAHENLGAGTTGLRYGPAEVLVPDMPDRERQILAADMNGDGLEDLVVSSADSFNGPRVGWYPNLGGFQLGQRRALQATDASRIEVGLGDLDGDGLLDVILARAAEGGISWQRNLGGGQFAPPVILTSVVQSAWGVAAGDLDGDGDLDVAYSGNNVVGWLRNDGAVGFAPAKTILVNSQIPTGTVICADMDGDGDDDLVAPVPAFGRTYGVYEALGSGDFAAPVMVSGNLVVTSIQAVDLGGDGDVDLVVNRSGSVAVIENMGGGSLAEARTVLTGLGGSNAFHAADADGDGDVDLLRLDFDFSSNSIAIHEGLSVFGSDVCGAGVPNSTGAPGELGFVGSPLLAGQAFGLTASSLPPFSFGYFLVGDAPDFVPLVNGSQGTLCLGGSLGRFVGPGQIQSSGAEGSFGLQVDLQSIPQASGPADSQVGTTWYFQAWHRDANPNPTSNFTSARSLLVR